MKKYLFLFFIPFVFYSQLNPHTLISNVQPLSPQAYQLAKVSEIPVTKYAGVANINIPLHTIHTKGLDIPLSLSYNSNGVKIDEESSWVGLGWNLNADMQIVQQVVGLDDYGYYWNRVLPNFDCMIRSQSGGLSGSTAMAGCSTLFLGYDSDWNKNHPDCYFDTLTAAGLKDTQPDVFLLNFLGYSYKFVLDWQTLKFKCLNDKNVIIKSNADGLNLNSSTPTIPNVFKISTPDGNLFLFTLKDITKINYNSNGQSEGGAVPTNINIVNEVSSRVYKLTSIITNKDEMIKFNYEYSERIENGNVYKNISKNLPNVIINYKSYVAEVGSNHVPATNGYVTSYTGTESTISCLKSIEYNDEMLEFITSSRVDFKEAKKLDKIVVKYKGISKKNIDFKFDYFVADDSGDNWDSFLNRGDFVVNKTQDELTKRLKLLSVNAFNETPFIFEYNSNQLPKKTSYAKDYWGFYNGMKSNNSFFPNIYSFNLERDNYRYYNFQQNNNSPQVDFCQASILNKIIYPTGGSDTFDYELNTFDNYAVPPIDQGSAKAFYLTTVATPTANIDQICLVEGGSTIFKIKGLLSTKGCFPQYPEAYSRCFLKVLNFKKELIDYINLNFSNNLKNYGLKYVLAVDLDFLDGSPSNTDLYNNFFIPENSWTYRKTINNNNDEFIDTTQILKEGIAIFSVSGGCGIYSPNNITNPNWSQSSFNISYRDYKPFSQSSSIGAGLRIKSITSKGFNEIVELKKEYSYEGGKIMSPLLFFNKTITSLVFDEVVGISSTNDCLSNINIMIQSVANVRRIENAVFNDATRNKLASEISALNRELSICKVSPIIIRKNFYGTKNELSTSSFNPVSTSASGSFVGYQKVVEKFINIKERSYSNNLGRIETNYINNPDLGSSWNKNGGGYYTDLSMPLVPVFPENGLVLKEKLFNQANDSIKVTSNNYKVANENCLWGMKIIPTEKSSQILSLGYFEFRKYLVGVYPLRIGKSLLIQSKTINFTRENGITREVSEMKNFSYDIYNQLSGESYYDSKGNLHEKFYKYCYDFNKFGDNFYVGMQNKNFITPIIETATKLGSAITSLEMNTFKEITLANSLVNIFVPEKIKFAKSGNIGDLEERVIYHKYDSNSNPIEISKKDNSIINFIWGYKGQYPIAKIENSTISQIESALGLSYDTLDETKLASINVLRTSLTNAMITTYTYNPLVGVSTITDPKGLKTTYEYDSFNRLKWVKDQDDNILKKYCYNYKGQQVNCGEVVYKNVAKSGIFTRNNCGNGFTGSLVTYNVLAGLYSSTISQTDADNKAQSDVNANGQNYANVNGGCSATVIYKNVVTAGTFKSQLCASNETASPITYTVNAGAYSSIISQDEADLLALNDVRANGQNYANDFGECNPSRLGIEQ